MCKATGGLDGPCEQKASVLGVYMLKYAYNIKPFEVVNNLNKTRNPL